MSRKVRLWIHALILIPLALFFLVHLIADRPYVNSEDGAQRDEPLRKLSFFHKPIYRSVQDPIDMLALTYQGGGTRDANVRVVAWLLENHNFKEATAVGYDVDISGFYDITVFLAAQRLHVQTSAYYTYIHYNGTLRSDDVMLNLEDDSVPTGNLHVIGLIKPSVTFHDGSVRSFEDHADTKKLIRFDRGYSSPFMPFIPAGSSLAGLALVACLPILVTAAWITLFKKHPSIEALCHTPQKRVVYHGLLFKSYWIFFVLFFLPVPWMFYTGAGWFWGLLRWITPLLTLPALSLWIAGEKRQYAPLVALACSIICLYQPTANILCFFGTVILDGYLIILIKKGLAAWWGWSNKNQSSNTLETKGKEA